MAAVIYQIWKLEKILHDWRRNLKVHSHSIAEGLILSFPS